MSDSTSPRACLRAETLERIVAAARQCRAECCAASGEVPVRSGAFARLYAAMVELDALVEDLTGQRELFWFSPHGGGAAPARPGATAPSQREAGP